MIFWENYLIKILRKYYDIINIYKYFVLYKNPRSRYQNLCLVVLIISWISAKFHRLVTYRLSVEVEYIIEFTYISFIVEIYWITKCTTTGYLFLLLFSSLKKREEEKENELATTVLNKFFLNDPFDFTSFIKSL